MATLTIGIPVFNGGRFLESAIQSVVSQTLRNLEIIISDNASTDDTSAICLRFAALDSRIKYLRQKSTIGVADNFRLVVEAASGDFFGWHAHDDVMDPEFCMMTHNYLVEHPSVVCVSGDFHNIDSAGLVTKEIQLADIRDDVSWEERIRLFYYQSMTSKAYMCIYGLFRRQLLLDVLHQIKTGPILTGMEVPILSRLATMGEIASVPVVLRAYRTHSDSVSNVEWTTKASRGWRGFIHHFYGRLWYKRDQLGVLLHSALSLRLKLSIMVTVLRYHVRRGMTLIARRCRPPTRT